MKAIILNSLYFPNKFGGAEKITQVYAEGLQEMGVEPVVVSLGPKLALNTVNGIKVYYIPVKNFYISMSMCKPNVVLRVLWHLVEIYNPLMAREVSRIIDREKPDVVHTNALEGFSVAVWAAIKSRGLPIIHTIHSHYLLCSRATMFNRGKNCTTQCSTCRVFSYSKLRLSSLVDRAVGVSSYILGRHHEAGYFPNATKQTIYNPIPLKKQLYMNSPKRPLRFGYIGRLEEPKGVETLLAAFSTIDFEKATLTLAGPGELPYAGWLQEQYGAENISFLGYVPADDFYREIDVLVVPSRCQDSLPTVVLEAYSHGLPVIGSRRGGIPEMVEDGITGFLFEPESDGELASLMNKFIEEPGLSLELGQNSWKKADEFSPANTIRQYFDLYKSL
jgi:glycosyltransferase involved in cell wall biosynthesis